MSTTRCTAAVLRVLLRGRVAPAVLTALGFLPDSGHLAAAIVLCLGETVLALRSQTWPAARPAARETAGDYRATNVASSACTS
ncbi:hypothetical protein SAMN05216188_10587 [Lentzea xinjiangensis]|uniref:Uncharacterized protein n=1 Tax=Lentzea xinjiangensis TaxID=402600 RepID=A0A1H9IV98_9PSEU|nr:hypothetical protein [Lentzea xinjiangensis]SEQ78345.1 hypothetical protein SAMN05216188_10587 [Lentzea xinjiangensis]